MQVILTEEEYEELKRKADTKADPEQDYIFLQSKILEVLEGFSKGFEEVVQKYGGMEFSLNPVGITRDFIKDYTERITSTFKR